MSYKINFTPIDKNIMEVIDNELFWDTIKCLNVVREERHGKGLKKLGDKISEGHIKILRNLLYYLYDDHQEEESESEEEEEEEENESEKEEKSGGEIIDKKYTYILNEKTGRWELQRD